MVSLSKFPVTAWSMNIGGSRTIVVTLLRIMLVTRLINWYVVDHVVDHMICGNGVDLVYIPRTSLELTNRSLCGLA